MLSILDLRWRQFPHAVDLGTLKAVAGRAGSWARQAFCGVHGHDYVLHRRPDRLSLQCTTCGRETHGWEIGRRRGR